MKRVFQEIKVYDGSKLIITFPYIGDIAIETDKNTFTDTAVIRLPRKTFTKGDKLTDYISVGNRIVIKYGYLKYKDITEFEGYIVSISNKTVIEIKVEDKAFLYKTEVLETKVFRNVKLSEIIGYYYKDEYISIDANIGDWVVNKNSTLIDLFDELRNKLGILSYWQNGILYVGAETKKDGKTIIFNVKENVPKGSDSIETNRPTDVGVVSYGISPQKDGSKIERYAYYKDATRTTIIVSETKPKGTINTMNIRNLTLSSLIDLIKRRLPNLYTNVTSGTIQTFGVPTVEHGDYAKVLNTNNKDIQGVYNITGVSKSFSVSGGIKQTAKIGLKVKNIS